MPELKIVEERPIMLAELKDILKKVEKRDTELTFRGNKTKEYLNSFSLPNNKELYEHKKQIEELNIPRLKDRQIIKILDVMPKDIDSMKVLLSGEAITIKEEDMKRIISIIK